MITARHYETAADVLAGAHAVRMRLMKPSNAIEPVRALPAPVIRIAPRPKPDAPLWSQEPTHFNDHVLRWQWNRGKLGPRLTPFIAQRAKELGVSFAEVMGNSRNRHITGARQMIWYELRTVHRLSYLHIGAICGRDHSSIIHGVKRVAEAFNSKVPLVVNDASRIVSDRALNALLRHEYQMGESQASLAKRHNLSQNAIQRIAKLENWPKENTSSILKYDLGRIKQAYNDGWLLKDITDTFGIPNKTLARIRKSLGWPTRDKVAARADAEIAGR